MALYESVFIARQDISSAQVEDLGKKYAKIIEDNGGKVTKQEYWGLRNFAYRIKKSRKGHYMLLNIDAPPPALHEMERQMGIDEDVLRTLSLRVEEFEEGDSVMMRNAGKEERRRSFGSADEDDDDDSDNDYSASSDDDGDTGDGDGEKKKTSSSTDKNGDNEKDA